MSTPRKTAVVIASSVTGAVLVAGGLAWWAQRERGTLRASPGPAIAAVDMRWAPPATPNLSRWPQAFRDRLEAAQAEVRRSPESVEALARLAVLYHANAFATQAESVWRRLRVLDPAEPRWCYLLGVLRQRAGDGALAAELFAETLARAPDYAPALLQRGLWLSETGATAEARRLLEKRLRIVPGDYEAIYALAKLDDKAGDRGGAIRRLEALVRARPEIAEGRQLLADLCEAEGNGTLAAELRRGLAGAQPAPPARDPWLDELYLDSYDVYRLQALGSVRTQAGLHAEALPLLARAARLAPDDGEIQQIYAQTQFALGRVEEAEATLNAAIERTPSSAALYSLLVDVLAARGRTVEAVTRIGAATVRFPRDAELRNAFGRALDLAGRTAEAVGAFEEALRLSPVLTEAQLNLGRGWLKLGRRDEARAAVAKACAMRPEFVDAHVLATNIELEDGRLMEAEARAEALRSLASPRPEVRRLYALVKFRFGNELAQAGRNAEAEQRYRDGLAADEGYGPLHGGLGMLFGKQRRFAGAIEEFNRYVQLAPEDATALLLLGSAQAAIGEREQAQTTFAQGLALARKSGDAATAARLERLLGP